MSTLQAIAVIVGVVSGVSGLVLGILNYWEHRVSTRPRIVVRLAVAKTLQQTTHSGVVQVCNVGQVPVVVMPIIGFRRQNGSFTVSVALGKGGDLPDKLELKPQHAAMLELSMDNLPEGRKLGRAFVVSVIGDTFKASRRDMREFAKQRREASSQPSC